MIIMDEAVLTEEQKRIYERIIKEGKFWDNIIQISNIPVGKVKGNE